MPEPAPSLLEAALRRKGAEDRLTELLAVALNEHTEFAREVLGLVLDSAPTGRLEVKPRTQLYVSGYFVDLELRFSLDGDRQGPVWFENKVGADFGHRQLPNYMGALLEHDPGGRLAAIVPRRRWNDEELMLDSGRLCPLVLWQDILLAADRASREESTADEQWLKRPHSPHEPARVRLLADFVRYLLENAEELNVNRTPLTAKHEPVLRDAVETLRVVTTLLDTAIERSGYESSRPGPRLDKDHRGLVQTGAAVTNQWRSGKLRVYRDAHRSLFQSDAEPNAGPVFAVGLRLDTKEGQKLLDGSGEELAEWRERMRVLEVNVASNAGVRVCRVKPINELTRLSTFDEQCDSLAAWLQDSLETILSNPAPGFEVRP